MKKTILLLSLVVGTFFGASAQCTPDTTHFTGGVYVYPAELTCIQHSIAYSETQTIKIPDSLVYSLGGQSIQGYIDSVRIDSITGEPAGITSQSSPALGTWIQPHHYACAIFTGSTVAPAGSYPLTISGRACGHITVPVLGLIDTCTNYTFTRSYPDTLKVCNPAGISNVAQDLSLNVFPNPSNGNFTVTVSSATAISGTISVLDQLGRTVYAEAIEVSGTKQIPLTLTNAAPGAYLLQISTQKGRSVKQFIIN